MFKKIVLIVVLLALCSSVFALDMSKAEPYSNTEFPKWSLDLRRSEIIFFGGIPIVYPLTALAMNTFKADTNFWKNMGITCSITAAIAIADYVIGLVQK